jgi:pyruvate/2-oxoglutarate dehydrogenase complex dihydrolipoamide acyltransferase (E2) component
MSEMTTEQAAALVEADKQRRMKLAAEAVQAALAEHGCDLLAVPQIAPDGRVVAVVQLVAR